MEIADGSLFLGLDSSTQSLKAVLLRFHSHDRQLKYDGDFSVNYDQDLPQYATSGGVHRGKDGLTVTAPTLMWVEALDHLLLKMKASNVDFAKIMAVSGSGQQHGSVYWNGKALQRLSTLSAGQTLLAQLSDCFSVPNSPIWMDSSTTNLCREIEALFPAGAADVASRTGSRAYERFTLSQIAKVRHVSARGMTFCFSHPVLPATGF